MNGKGALSFLALALVFAANAAAGDGQVIPRTNPDDKGVYYLVKSSKSGTIVQALSKRVDSDGVGFTLSETDCAIMQMRVLGYSDTAPSKIRKRPTPWFALEPGTSKSDLAIFVCK